MNLPAEQESAAYHKFLKIPARISGVLFIVQAIASSFALYRVFSVSVATFLLPAAGAICLVSMVVANQLMVRDRMWLWGKHYFADWKSFQNWVNTTRPKDMETAISNPDWKL